jgi:bifunctional UDP-N-acetylglucosamine pyrophosphorylase/glucosamine-1-phosphate N-acetyltransferase
MKSSMPKSLHRVCGIEMLLHVIDAIRGVGIVRIAVVVPQGSRPFRSALGDSVLYATQAEPLGTGHALLQARSVLDDANNILVLYGDTPLILPATLERLAQRHSSVEAHATVITSHSAKPQGMGRVVRDECGVITAIIEERDADADTLTISEVNSGFYCFRAPWVWQNLERLTPAPNGELLLTDLIHATVRQGLTVESIQSDNRHETMGVNDRLQLAEAEGAMRDRIREHWMLTGVTMPDISSVYIDRTVKLGQDTIILPNTHILGQTTIGADCTIGPNAIIENSTIGDDCEVVSSVVRDSTLESGVGVGPFSHIRGGSYIESSVHIGTSAEVKNSRLGRGTKMGHFSYMGDATLGADVNIGAGAITCNFDGVSKHETIIGKDAFIGSDTMLVAPVVIGDGAATGAGAVVTKDVPAGSTVVGVPARNNRVQSEKKTRDT